MDDNKNQERIHITREEYRQIKKKKKVRLKPWSFCVFLIFFLGILAISIYKVYSWDLDNKKIKKITDDLNKEVKPVANNEEGELINPPDDKNSDYWYYVSLPFYDVDFETLKEKNQDTVAFIHMSETNINYPVVQTNDNEYYLGRAFDKSKNEAGWVFMDYRNDVNNLSDNTIIYGHGRLDKTVFGSLKNSLKKSWQENKDNYIIWLSTPTENMMFQIFSIYTIKSESYYITTDFKNENDKQAWIDTMIKRNTTNKTNNVSISDKFLTLSTCLNNNGERVVVQAKLIKKQKRQ